MAAAKRSGAGKARVENPVLVAKRHLGVTGSKLAWMIGVSNPTISRMLRGQRKVGFPIIQRLADVCGVSLAEFTAMMSENSARPLEAESSLTRLRVERGLTQGQLAELIGTSQPQIQRLEKGLRPLEAHWAEKLAPVLDVTPAYLMFGEEVRVVPREVIRPAPMRPSNACDVAVMNAARRLHEMLPLTVEARGVLYTLLDLMEMDGGSVEANYGLLAYRLGMPRDDAEALINSLRRSGYVQITEQGRIDSKLRGSK